METIREILGLPFNSAERSKYNANSDGKRISEVIIDGNAIRGYKAFSFIYEKTFTETPSRSFDGSMPTINQIPTFVVPHLKIDFSLLFIDDYRKIMQLLYARNEHDVTCYDIVGDKQATHKMYFATEEMPKLWAIAESVSSGTASDGYEYNTIELLFVQDYTVELIGTNNDARRITVTYNSNTGASSYTATEIFSALTSIVVGDSAMVTVNSKPTAIQDMQVSGKKFAHWCTDRRGGEYGLIYKDGDASYFVSDTTLYAIWENA